MAAGGRHCLNPVLDPLPWSGWRGTGPLIFACYCITANS